MVFLFGRGRKRADPKLIDGLHDSIVAAVRRPDFYRSYQVADTFEGRFELLVLHAGLVLRRLNGAEAPGPLVAQELVDAVFRSLEAALREAGVGDLAVPKRMKKLAEAFLGRSAAYALALDAGGGGLAEALSRNVYAGAGDGHRLAAYAVALAAALDETPVKTLVAGAVPFPALDVAHGVGS